MSWPDAALLAIWLALAVFAVRYWLTEYRRDNDAEHQRRQLLRELNRHNDKETESGNHEA